MMKRFGAGIGLAVAVMGLVGCGNGATPGQLTTQATKKLGAFASQEQGSRQVVRIAVKTRAQVNALASKGYDLFENVNLRAGYVDATVTRKDEGSLRAAGFTFTVLQSADQVFRAMGSFVKGYHTVDEVTKLFQEMAATNPNIAQYKVIGKSVNGKDIPSLRITSKPGTNLPQILVDSGQHARELPPVEISLRLAQHLTSQYGKDPEVTKLVDTRDITIVPVVNVDGRQNVEGGDAFWRKNMRKNPGGSRGVDTNRNSDDHWNQGSNNSWADDFHGPTPTSEPETQAMRDLVASNKFTVSLDIHNYAGMVLFPPGFDSSNSKDDSTFRKIAKKIADPIGYSYGTIAQSLYNTYGDFSTWQYQKFGIIAFGVELDDPGFNAPFQNVEKDWSAWKDNLMYLIGVSEDPRKAAAEMDQPTTLLGFKL